MTDQFSTTELTITWLAALSLAGLVMALIVMRKKALALLNQTDTYADLSAILANVVTYGP